MEAPLVIGYDLGTTGAKTCLFRLGDRIELLGRAMREYPLQLTPGGGAEQHPADWWRAMTEGTGEVLRKCGVAPGQVRALSFSAGMQSFVPVDATGEALRPAMTYLDQRAEAEQRRVLCRAPRVSGMNAFLLGASLHLTGGVSASVKDPVWKYAWMREHEPGLFGRLRWWLDVKDYLTLRCTGRATMTEDSANATFLYDTRGGGRGWSPLLCRWHGVNRSHLPEVVKATEIVGPLTAEAARELGLEPGVLVVAGGGDLTMQTLGAGCVDPGDTHVYIGTSGWVASVVTRRTLDLKHLMASILGARPGHYNYIGEQETSGKCLEWVRDHIALDEIGVFLSQRHVADDPEARHASILEFLGEVVADTPAGAGGVIFTPWLHGNRSPFEDRHARGMFFNIGLDSGKRRLIRAVVEGILYQKRWYLECMARRCAINEPLRFVGGGALSPVTAQILADITGRTVAVVEMPQDAGAVGAAACCGLALGIYPGFKECAQSIRATRTHAPNPEHRAVYERNYRIFKRLYSSNRHNFTLANSGLR
ncbi:MAG: FGGY-family carbohydrate kinase [Verrucomicrobia bacterium]|nr:FGGY-family carbohydrate kinase [Verrucomicrobiota bacterium]